MESLVITENKGEFPEVFLTNPANFFISNSQAPLILPCFKDGVFMAVTVHNSILLGEKKTVTSLYSVLKDEGVIKVVTVGGKHPESLISYM